MIAASPATVTLQRFQQMTNRSPRALQLKRQSETMSPRASGENRPPQFRSDERHWLRSDPGHRADGSPGAVLQAVCKTPTLAEATPANMMTGPAEQGGKEPGLPDSTYVLINVDSPDNIVTLAHELAHVVGYNPTGVESSGHFTDSTSYQQAEAEYGPKLLFDAYYFEVLFRRLAGG